MVWGGGWLCGNTPVWPLGGDTVARTAHQEHLVSVLLSAGRGSRSPFHWDVGGCVSAGVALMSLDVLYLHTVLPIPQ